MKHNWITLESFWDVCRLQSISPTIRLLLSSDGSMVRGLNTLFLKPVALDFIGHREITVDEETSAVLEVAPGDKVIERTVWLTIPRSEEKQQRVIHAISKFPISRMKPSLYQEMMMAGKPIGYIVESQKCATWRDSLEIARRSFPVVAKGLQLPEETLFWARRYRLTFSDQVSAIICEVLSPELSLLSY